MFTVDRVNYAQWLPVNTHITEIFCSPPATGHGRNKPSPYLRQEGVKRMMVYVADAVEKGIKSVMFPTVSSNCCGHSRCEGTFGVLWDRKDPNSTSVCKGFRSLGSSRALAMKMLSRLINKLSRIVWTVQLGLCN